MPENLFDALLMIHIGGGGLALITGYAALMVKRGGSQHRTLGKLYTGGMVAVVLTGFPMSVLHPNPFLFGIAIFSGYFVLSGWTSARYRKGEARPVELMAAATLLFCAASALVYLLLYQAVGPDFSQSYWVTGLVFSVIGIAIPLRDLAQLRQGPLAAKDRIIKHLISMVAALIATTTAVAVTVFGAVPQIPSLVSWLGPTLVLTPVIAYWVRQLKAGTFRY